MQKKTHAIITYNHNHYLLTREEDMRLRSKKIDEFITINNNQIKVGTISEVMTIDKYYSMYPNQRPVVYKEIESGTGFSGVIKNSRKIAITGIIQGIKKYINSDKYQGTEEPKKLLAIAEERLAILNN